MTSIRAAVLAKAGFDLFALDSLPVLQCCSVLQCIAVCCIVLQRGAVWCGVLQYAAVCENVLQ